MNKPYRALAAQAPPSPPTYNRGTKKTHFNRLPSNKELSEIPLARMAEFELSEKEMKTLRSHIYKINKDGIRRYRTLRELNLVLVWRIK